MSKDEDAFEFVGLASLDTCVNAMNSQPSKLANSALQFIFNGYTGFTFPAAHYPVKGVSAEELNHLTHRLIHSLEKHGFNVSGSLKPQTPNPKSQTPNH